MANDSRSKKMARDFLVYSVGIIGSKLMTFLLLPVYTHFISDPAEYGYFDLCLTACFMLMPLVTLQMRDGAFRFLLETEDADKRSRIVTYINKTLFISTLVTLLAAAAMWILYPKPYLGYVVALLIVMSFYDVYAQTVRGLGNNRSFVMVSLICSFAIALFSVAFLLMGMGILGLFIANILARVIAVVAVDVREKVVARYFKPSLKDLNQTGKEILRFSLPLLPAGICWWFIGFSNRYFITENLSLHDSGIYGLASRLATVVQAIATIFLQTWQENAIQQYNSNDRNRFFSKVFNGYIVAFTLVIILYAFGAKLVFPILFNANYSESMVYLYPLCIATMFFALAGYFEIIYQCEKKTRRLLLPLIIAPFINVALNYMLIGPMGIYGVVISYAVTYIFIIACRWIDTTQWVKVRINLASLLAFAIMVIGAIPFVISTPLLVEIAIVVLSVASLLAIKDVRELIMHKNR